MTILFVHPHPDDEALLTGGLILRARAQRRRVVVVTATRGEEGGARAGGPGSLASVRTRELQQACALLGVDRHVFLEFGDSGLHRPRSQRDPRAFTAVPLAEAAAAIALVLREERPEVVVTATPDGTYGHPDHIRAHDATMAALEQLRTEAWTPDRIAMVTFPHGAAALVVHALLAFGLRPSGRLLREASISGLPGTTVRFAPLGDLMPGKRAAILAHRSQLRGRLRVIVHQPLLCRLVFGVERYLVAGSPAGDARAHTLFAYV